MPAKSFEPESVLLCLVSQLWRPGLAVNFLFVFHLFRQGCTTIFITNIQTWSSHNSCWFIILHSIYYFIILKKCFHYHFCFQRTKILRDAFQKKKSIWRDIVPTRGGGGKKTFEMSLLKIPFYLGTFFRGGGSQIIISFVLFVKIGLNAWKFVEQFSP